MAGVDVIPVKAPAVPVVGPDETEVDFVPAPKGSLGVVSVDMPVPVPDKTEPDVVPAPKDGPSVVPVVDVPVPAPGEAKPDVVPVSKGPVVMLPVPIFGGPEGGALGGFGLHSCTSVAW